MIIDVSVLFKKGRVKSQLICIALLLFMSQLVSAFSSVPPSADSSTAADAADVADVAGAKQLATYQSERDQIKATVTTFFKAKAACATTQISEQSLTLVKNSVSGIKSNNAEVLPIDAELVTAVTFCGWSQRYVVWVRKQFGTYRVLSHVPLPTEGKDAK